LSSSNSKNPQPQTWYELTMTAGNDSEYTYNPQLSYVSMRRLWQTEASLGLAVAADLEFLHLDMGTMASGSYEQEFRNNVTGLLADAARVPIASVLITRIQGGSVIVSVMVMFAGGQLSAAEYFRTMLTVDTVRIFPYDVYGGVTTLNGRLLSNNDATDPDGSTSTEDEGPVSDKMLNQLLITFGLVGGSFFMIGVVAAWTYETKQAHKRGEYTIYDWECWNSVSPVAVVLCCRGKTWDADGNDGASEQVWHVARVHSDGPRPSHVRGYESASTKPHTGKVGCGTSMCLIPPTAVIYVRASSVSICRALMLDEGVATWWRT
jgi:hypothetical protein